MVRDFPHTTQVCLLHFLNKPYPNDFYNLPDDAVILDVHPDEFEEIAYIIKKVTCKALPEAWGWINVPLDVDADLCPVDGSWNMKESYKLPEVK